MSTALTITETGEPVTVPSIIGFRVGNQTLGVLDTLRHVSGRITWSGLLKTSAATGIAAAATAIKAGHVALSEIEYSRSQMATHLALMQAQRDDAVNRAAIAEAKISRKVQRWSAAERDTLTRLRAGGMTYAKIAAAMSDEFGRAFTASSVGAQARKLGLVTPAKAKAAKPVSKRRRAV